MGIFTKKKEKIVTDYITEQVDGAEVFVVSLDTFKRLYPNSKCDSSILLQFAKDEEEARFKLQLKTEKQS